MSNCFEQIFCLLGKFVQYIVHGLMGLVIALSPFANFFFP